MRSHVLFFDIETSDLDADFGNMLAFGYKWLGDADATVLSLLDTNKCCRSCKRVDAVDDAKLVQRAYNVLVQADVWVTWYGKGFDAKYLNTRILDAGLDPLPATQHVDLYFAAKHKLKLSSNRLESVQNFLQLPAKKTPITKRVWRQAQAGDVASLEYVVDHCAKDVIVLEQAYAKLSPLVRLHPQVTDVVGACRVCGANKWQRRGTSFSRGKVIQRIQCTKCGRWDMVSIPKPPGKGKPCMR